MSHDQRCDIFVTSYDLRTQFVLHFKTKLIFHICNNFLSSLTVLYRRLHSGLILGLNPIITYNVTL